MVHDMPQGQPGPGDRGLDHTRNWGRTYWGGAVFCLLAGCAVPRADGNRRGLQHALRGILAAGGNVDTEWTMERTLSAGDDAAGVPVLRELYEQMKDAPVEVDLASLWRLGVSVAEGTVAFQEDAPLAAVRRAITSTYFH